MSRSQPSTDSDRQARRERRLLRAAPGVRDSRVVLTAELTADEHDLVRRCARSAGWGSSRVIDVREVAFHLPGRKVAALVIADSQGRAHAHHSESTLATLKRMQPLVEDRDIPVLFLLRWHNRDYVSRLLALGVHAIVALPAEEDDLVARVDSFLMTLRPVADQAA